MDNVFEALQYAGPAGFAVLAMVILYGWQQRPLMRKLLEVMDQVATRTDLNRAVAQVDDDREPCRSSHDTLGGAIERLEGAMSRVEGDSNWLREAHDRKDEDGVPVWYVPSRLFTEVLKQGEAAAQRDDAMMTTLQGLNRVLGRLEDRLGPPGQGGGT